MSAWVGRMDEHFVAEWYWIRRMMVEDEQMMWCKEKRKVALGNRKDLGGGGEGDI